MSSPLLGAMWQVGFVVDDLEDSIRQWSRQCDIGEWHIYTYGPDTVPYLRFNGKKSKLSYRLALSQSLVPQMEFIQPLDGPSAFDPWIKTHGPGLHHIAYKVDSLGDAIKSMGEMGHRPFQVGMNYGLNGDGGYAYYDLRLTLRTYIELVELPSVRRPPELILTGKEASAYRTTD